MCHRVNATMRCEPASVPAARHWAAGQLGQMYDQPGEAADDAELVVSELVGNCVRTDAHSFDLALYGHHDTLRVEATDDDPGQPRPRPANPAAEGGRGLLIVDNLASDWGVTTDARDKTVWADLAVASDSAPTFNCVRS